ncbi:hypothetical protein Tco_1427926 [Tanacetum coccineum]
MLTTPPPYVPFVIGWLRAGHDSDVSVAAATSLSLPLPHTFIISPPDQMHPSTHRPHQLLFYFHHCCYPSASHSEDDTSAVTQRDMSGMGSWSHGDEIVETYKELKLVMIQELGAQ